MDDIEVASMYHQSEVNAKLANICANVASMNTSVDDNEERYCEDCGKLIPRKRIQAVPGATRCVTCQELFDESQR